MAPKFPPVDGWPAPDPCYMFNSEVSFRISALDGETAFSISGSRKVGFPIKDFIHYL